jgi:uncharacterized membrane protein YraQ (UPF0718 family)
MMLFLHKLLEESWFILWSAAPYIVLGLLLGGLIKTGLNATTIRRHLGGSGMKPIFKAALLGVPLPLCSCGVLPVGAALRKEGASRGATAAFLIATPESGVDSIAISYALLDPILTVVRPLAAFVTAFAAGLGMIFLDRKEKPQAFEEAPEACSCSSCHAPLREETGAACCEALQHHHEPSGRTNHSSVALSLGRRLGEGFRYATGELWGHLALPFALGIFLSGLLGALLPENFLEQWLGGGLHSMLLMLLLGVPMYICATSSTPLAAAFILKGVSPGAALVFLLAGPATNISALPVLTKILGKKGLLIYLASIAAVSVGAGLLVDRLYQSLNLHPQALMGIAREVLPQEVHLAALIFLGLCTLPLLWRNFAKKTSLLKAH